MSDVFISYARSTAKQAQQVAEALGNLGYSVWRDKDLPTHRAYTDVIEEQLEAAKAVVVIWSAVARFDGVCRAGSAPGVDYQAMSRVLANSLTPLLPIGPLPVIGFLAHVSAAR